MPRAIQAIGERAAITVSRGTCARRYTSENREFAGAGSRSPSRQETIRPVGVRAVRTRCVRRERSAVDATLADAARCDITFTA